MLGRETLVANANLFSFDTHPRQNHSSPFLFFSFLFSFSQEMSMTSKKKKKTFHYIKKKFFGNLSKIIGARAGKLWESNSFSFFLSLSSLLCYSPANKKVRNWKN
jgi:hypothetical protein